MAKRRVLYVVHNHPQVRPGGAEAYALELYRAMRDARDIEPIFLAKGGPPLAPVGQAHQGTLIGPANNDPNQYFCFTDGFDYDWLLGTLTDKSFYRRHLGAFLRTVRPDVVHVQHTLHLGYDLIRQVRNSLPDAAIVYTLHEFLPICHRQGQMIRTFNTAELCTHASPRRCHECFPEISPQDFFLRQRFIQSHLSLVDLFIAPSQQLLERYVAWGLPRERMMLEEYGRLPVQRLERSDEERPRNRIGFFGQITPFKGVHILLRAMQLLQEHAVESLDAGVAPHLILYGANLDQQTGTFQNQVRELLTATESTVTFGGPYRHDELPAIMADIDWVVVPSIWWENSPLVIQEAFAYGRPVICSDIGGMAEKVGHGENGLHFRVHDPADLAHAIQLAVSTPGLWERLRAGIKEVHSMDRHIRVLTDVYAALLARDPRERASHREQ